MLFSRQNIELPDEFKILKNKKIVTDSGQNANFPKSNSISFKLLFNLVWGFTAKSNIESLFRIQKKGIRAIVPGFINYKYRDGELPGHTEPYFNEYTILDVHGVIVTNALLFIHKIR